MDSRANGYEAAKEKLAEANRRSAEAARAKYLANPKVCPECGEVIPYEKRKKGKYCSYSCAASYNNKHRKSPKRGVVCLQCGVSLVGKPGKKFCSNRCSAEYNFREFIKRWLNGEVTGTRGDEELSGSIRRYLIEKHQERCELCGWSERNPITGLVPIQVDHIDGNSRNNRPENLRLLCPNCHSLTHTYGGLNRGNGRKKRYKLRV